MTCKEKLMQDHPDWDSKDVLEYIMDHCPRSYMANSEYCRGTDGFHHMCFDCWAREILHPYSVLDSILENYRISQNRS